MYYIDSPSKKVWSFDYSVQSGEISSKHTTVDFEETRQTGIPDGMAVDAEGMIWVAHWGGARVTRWRPTDGKLFETLPIPVDEVTSCCFGRKNLEELYITSAREGLDEKSSFLATSSWKSVRCQRRCERITDVRL
jgi:sugar lactone lactonase YvrE